MISGFNEDRIKSSMDKAEDYTSRRRVKHEVEMNLVKKAFLSLNYVKKVRDAPCGIGGVTVFSGGRKSSQENTSIKDINGYFQQVDYMFAKDFVQMSLVYTLHLFVFKRETQ